MKSNSISILIITTLLISCIFININVGSETHTGFSNPGEEDERVLTLIGNGTAFIDSTTYFDITMEKGSVLDAEFNISVMDDNGNYPLNPRVDVGLDGDIDWEFKGTGYSKMGSQSLFVDNTDKKTLNFPSPGTDVSAAKIRMPYSAEVDAAGINLTGRMSEPLFSETSFKGDKGLDGANYIDIGDMDGDGWNDTVVTANGLGKLVWYKNDGTPSVGQWQMNDIDPSLPNAWDLFIADIDGDGDNDVVATGNNYNFGVYWYKNYNTTNDSNPGNGTSWLKYRVDNVSYPIINPRRVFVADIDNDNDNDTIVCSNNINSGGIYWFENINGNGSSWVNHTVYSGKPVEDIYAANINYTAPTRLDIAATINYYQWPNPQDYYVVWFENDGTPKTPEQWLRHNISYVYRPYCVYVADIDQDSDNDVIATEYYSGLYWFPAPNSGITTTTQWTQYRIAYPYRARELRAGRINNDSDIDIVTNSDYYHDVFYYENPKIEGGSWSNWPATTIDGDLNQATGLALGDIDKDINSTNDILATGYRSAEVKWYSNDGFPNPKFLCYYVEEVSIKGPYGIFVADIDDDSHDDMIVSGQASGDVVWCEAPDDPTNGTWNRHIVDRELVGALELYVDDIDGDGDKDIAATANEARMIVWYEQPDVNVTNATTWERHIVDTALSRPWGICIADIDMDGDMDLVATDESYYDLYWYQNNDVTPGMGDGDGTSWTKFVCDNNLPYYPMGVDVGDIDNDGDLDIVVGLGSWNSGSTGIYWFEAPLNNPATTPWIKHTISSSMRQVYDVAIADVDDDGNLDVVAVTNYYGGVFWYEAPDNASATWTLHWIESSYYLWAYSLWVDDIGNDGYLDVVAGSSYFDKVYWYEEPDDPVNSTTWNKYQVDISCPGAKGVFIADIDNDGLKDIAAVGSDSDEVSWYNVSIRYPEGVTIEIGSTSIFQESGTLQSTQATNDFANALNSYLATTTPTFEDNYGNKFVDVTLSTTSSTRGRIKIDAIDITYGWTATIMKKDQEDLAMELTDLIPATGSGTHRVYIQVYSETPCKLKVADLYIRYNGAPDYSEIPDLEIDEDTTEKELIDLTEYFTDDYNMPDELFFNVVNYTNPENVSIRIYSSRYLSVNTTRKPNTNWNGVCSVIVSASDSEGVARKSNMFNVTVKPVNDPPTVNVKIQDIELVGNWTSDEIILDGNNNYFVDIDSEELYFAFDLGSEYQDRVSVAIVQEGGNNVLKVVALSEVEAVNVIPIRIYCDDKPIAEVTKHELEVYQDLNLKLVPVGDESLWLAPRWHDIPDLYIIEDTILENWANLTDFVYDVDDVDANLTFEIVLNSNTGYIDVIIDDKNRLDVYPRTDYHGMAEVIIKVEDDELNFALEKFTIYISPGYDPVIVEFLSPADEAGVAGLIRIVGTATDIDHTLQKVEIRFDEDDWQKAQGRGYWYFDWNSENYPDGAEVTITARAYNGINNSDEVSIEVTVDNSVQDTDGDGWIDTNDEFPEDPSEWKDTDGDGVGDNSDAFPLKPKEWLDSDGDGLGDNQDDFPEDPTQHVDSDDDGYGDNLEGNNPDFHPNDPDKHAQTDDEPDSSVPIEYFWYGVVAFTAINLFIIFWGLSRRRKQTK